MSMGKNNTQLGGIHTLVINPCACAARFAARVTGVVVCVCQSVHLTLHAINRSTNNTTYSVLGIGGKMCRVFSEIAAFESYSVKT